MIEITNLHKTYHTAQKDIQALRSVNLKIESGMFGLLGPNGAGKTTLMRILAGIVTPSKGSVIVNGNDLASEKGRHEMKASLGYLPQELGMYNELTPSQFVDYMAVLKGMNDARIRRWRVEQTLDLVGLGDEGGRKIKGFSGGMKRRVGIAQALVNDPKVLIVDEPTAGLDPEERIRLRNLLVKLATDRIVLLSTHIVEDIGQTCSDMAVLSHGQVIYRGSPSELIRSAQGHVWTLTSSTEKPNHNLTVVSMLHLSEGTQYRLVGQEVSAYPQASATQPGLEDGYVWLMKMNGHEVEAV
ncbi:MAG: ABC transporter ATP-binding protein [Anaerolineaceae bacterium]|nr:ABC transporter ATP-binding protein [Anaerolineaceae bacterium]